MFVRLIVLVAIVYGGSSNKSMRDSYAPVISTDIGDVRGFIKHDQPEVDLYWGIPFAHPPVKEKRFRPPFELKGKQWPDVRDTVEIKESCIQFGSLWGTGDVGKGSEDCLYLNIFKPHDTKAGENLPVMFWIYGGGYIIGGSWDGGMYDGTTMVKENRVVVVTIGYRLGFYGFLSHPQLKSKDGTSGNNGLLDQQEALRWVKRNIYNFGGNANKVNIFGQSAGGFSVMWHLVSNASKTENLFQSAVMESGTADTSFFFQAEVDANKFYQYYIEKWGCGTTDDILGCLQGVDGEMIVTSVKSLGRPPWASLFYPLMPFGPVIDGSALLGVPLYLVQKGYFHNVPLIISVNKDEGSLFTLLIPSIIPGTSLIPTMEEATKMLSYLLRNSSLVDQSLELYKDYYEDAPLDVLRFRRMEGRVLRDYMFHCPARRLRRAWSSHGGDVDLSVFSYYFGNKVLDIILGDMHASELPFVFRNEYLAAAGAFPTPELGNARVTRLSKIMSCIWVNHGKCHGEIASSECAQTCENGADLSNIFMQLVRNSSQEVFLSFRQGGTILSLQSNGPTWRYTGNNSFSREDRYADEFASADKCDFWDSLPRLPWNVPPQMS